jgi:radical SAM enzyme (TIGR01210 family)
MCDLWRGTTMEDTPRGAISQQIANARHRLRDRQEDITQIKLYNAGSFFDPRAVPEDDYDAIAVQLTGIDRVIVESHPALIGPRVDGFLASLARGGASGVPPRLEVAMGLETVHPEALERLNKRMTVDDFARAADLLQQRDDALRVFLLISPPGIPLDEQDEWLCKSVDAALACGATAISLVPTRGGNGALEALAASGAFRAPRLEDIERSAEAALLRRQAGGRIFVDVWDLERFSDCEACFAARRARLQKMNLEQRAVPSLSCARCAS